MRDRLFEPLWINSLELHNRILMPAMHLNMADNFTVTEQMRAFYAARAKGGVGLITVGYATVDELSGNFLCLGAHEDAHVEGLASLADAIHEGGAPCAVQLNHSGRYNYSFLLGGQQPVAPSAVASRMTREEPRALTIPEIKGVVASFAAAAGRVKAAGYDAVEILSGTGYLISEFLSPLTNLREDEYGGSLSNRMRFGLEILSAVRAEVGRDFPITYRINGNDFMPGGNGREDLQEYAVALTNVGVDALCINVGWHEARVPQIVTSVPKGVFGYLAQGIRQRVDVPIIASHRIPDARTAREMIDDGVCDAVAMGRALIADPELPNKAKARAAGGDAAPTRHCVACAQGCFDKLFQGEHVVCLCNPRAGFEHLSAPKAECAKKVMVVGGGPGGMSAALAAASQGHDVALFEREGRLGGQLHLASAPPGREEFIRLAEDLVAELATSRVNVVLGTDVDEKAIRGAEPDLLILATGAQPTIPPIPGVERLHDAEVEGTQVVQAWNVLAGLEGTGQRVVVIGGGAVGVESALYLAEKGSLTGEALKFLLIEGAETVETLRELAIKGTKEVCLVEMVDRVGQDIGRSSRWVMMQEIARRGVNIKTATQALEIGDGYVRVEGENGVEDIPADTVVLAAGAESHSPLVAVAQGIGIETVTVGDAQGIAQIIDAVHQGHAAGMKA